MGSTLDQPGMFAGIEYNNSDEVYNGSSHTQSDDMSDSLGALSDELGSFHISQPTTYATNATTLNSKISKPLKAYQTNNSFSESAFISQFHDDNDKDNDDIEYDSSVSPSSVLLNKDLEEEETNDNDDDDYHEHESIMDYGTVNRRTQKSTRGTTMEISPPQFIPYMKSHMKSTSPVQRLNFSYNNDNGELPLSSEDLKSMIENEDGLIALNNNNKNNNKTGSRTREPESALIIRDIGELSGQMMNTFKKKNELQQSRIYHDETTSEPIYNDENNENKTTNNSNSNDDGVNEFANSSVFEDEDPALAAKQVYNNLLRTQGSRFDMKRNITNRTISTRGSSVSGTNHNNSNELNLITPSSIGYRFKHSKGIWVPEDEFQNISTSQVEETTATTTTNTSKMNHSSTKNTTSTFTMEEEEEEETQDDIVNSTTPLDPPRVDQETLIKSVFSQGRPNNVTDLNQREALKDTSKLSDIPEMSFSGNKQQTVSLLLSALESTVPHPTNWEQVHDLKISHQRTLRSVVALGTYTPNLIKLDVSHNKIGNVEGLPITLKELGLRDNEINDTFCIFAEDNRLHILDLSHNLLARNLQILKSSHNLLSVDVSHNSIVSLAELGDSMIRSLDVSYNLLSGIIDFEKVVLQNDNRLGGWLTLESLDLSGNTRITELRHLEKLPCLKMLRVNDISGLMITHTESSALHELEIICSYNGKEGNSGEILDLKGFPYLKILSIDSEKVFGSAMPPTLRTVTIMGDQNREQNSKHFSDTLSKIPREICSLNIIDSLQLDPLSLLDPAYFNGLQQLSLKGCGVGSAYALLSRLPSPQTLQRLDISGTPLAKRRILAVSSSVDGRNQFKKQLTGLVRATCPALQQLIF
ncbi:similar to Saccharomyces cerevisiae YOR373W NUD1 Component of the spindle pole body outer plaque, required for exit from mitosis [Maudiozyma saulgeensis]|uniref:Similar to Saccharomyces cerevisiae YOR373W NUD1 Component of the spindle pole body outer plaque, required for exit from mitosis n=1 Tax=Maudiozyma saulgeensis TaxID=1789683 RepID=A0A1X7R835_9SACH|nr:similar to Saccharomyces cerevisiae YOR373W NUD1 Component of the spindle pole body outer plaque, required for exit from mitosis [Kazachstania saulgeensis]